MEAVHLKTVKSKALSMKKINRIMETAICEFTNLELLVTTDDDQLTLGFPWIAVVYDGLTSYPLGYSVTFSEPPQAFLDALRHAILPKFYTKSRYPKMTNEWLSYGVPDTLLLDYSKLSVNQKITDACAALNINIMHRWEGKKPNLVASKEMIMHLQNKADGFSITRNELHEEIHVWLIDIYAQRFSERLGESPDVLWREALKQDDRRSMPNATVDWNNPYVKRKKVPIEKTGITVYGIIYYSDELDKLRIRLIDDGRSLQTKTRIDISDLSQVYVYDTFKSEFISVPALTSEEETLPESR
jgi:putative transposase